MRSSRATSSQSHPPALHYGAVETIASKLTRQLPIVTPTVLTYADGNFGRTDSLDQPSQVQKILIDLQWIVLIVGALVFTLAGPQERRFPQTMRGQVILVITLVVLLLLSVVGWPLYALPTLSFIPPDKIVSGATCGYSGTRSGWFQDCGTKGARRAGALRVRGCLVRLLSQSERSGRAED